MEKQAGFCLNKKLQKLAEADIYPFHMPGHKRNAAGVTAVGNPFLSDITEIEGFDNLHHPEGVLLESMRAAASVYGADDARYLVNGSTCGILAALFAAVKPGGKILMARNCHKSAYHGLILGGYDPVFILPEMLPGGIAGGILPEEVSHLLAENPGIQAVFITSPTYEGVVSDVEAIARAAHRHGVPLIVDEAHGAHFPFGKEFPESAVSCGADVIIESLHKTLPALTQTAILLRRGDRVKQEAVDRYLAVFETSSPSYVLMASAENAVREMAENGERHLSELFGSLQRFRKETENLPGIRLLGPEIRGKAGVFDLDPSKLTFLFPGNGSGLSGTGFAAMLRERKIEPEMAGRNICLLMTSPWDKAEGFGRLTRAVKEIAGKVPGEAAGNNPGCGGPRPGSGIAFPEGADPGDKGVLPERALLPAEAFSGKAREVSLFQAAGLVSAGFVTLYPPGIPCIIPGERFEKDLAERIALDLEAGLTVEGLADGKVRVL